MPTDRPDRIPIGVPLPPSAGKARIALSLAPDTTIVRCQPLLLHEAAGQTPPGWGDTIEALDRLGLRIGVRPAVYGALLWQTLTGLTYLSARSDLDLLWTPARETRAVLLEGLRAIEAMSPMAIDGEILLEDGEGVSWRELDRASEAAWADVVTKSMTGPRLRPVDTILGGPERSEPC